jgi:hypothetical protein
MVSACLDVYERTCEENGCSSNDGFVDNKAVVSYMIHKLLFRREVLPDDRAEAAMRYCLGSMVRFQDSVKIQSNAFDTILFLLDSMVGKKEAICRLRVFSTLSVCILESDSMPAELKMKAKKFIFEEI